MFSFIFGLLNRTEFQTNNETKSFWIEGWQSITSKDAPTEIFFCFGFWKKKKKKKWQFSGSNASFRFLEFL